MIIVTNPGNPYGLAFLTAGKFAKKPVKVEQIENNGETCSNLTKVENNFPVNKMNIGYLCTI